MKKIIALTCLLSAFVLNAKAETKILVSYGDPHSFTIEEGQSAKMTSFINRDYRNKGSIEFKYKNLSFNFGNGNYFDISGDNLPTIPGPATITLTVGGSSNYGRGSMVTFEIKNDLGGEDGNNVTVLPKETENMTLLLESSDDMVKWTADSLGDKPKGNRKKFYRLRAVKK
jgi:hypothetical protein